MQSSNRLGISPGQIVLLVVLVTLLILTGGWAVSVWNASSGVEMGKHGWIALGLGTFFSLIIGCGLMALMFTVAATMMPPTRSGAGRSRPATIRSSRNSN